MGTPTISNNILSIHNNLNLICAADNCNSQTQKELEALKKNMFLLNKTGRFKKIDPLVELSVPLIVKDEQNKKEKESLGYNAFYGLIPTIAYILIHFKVWEILKSKPATTEDGAEAAKIAYEKGESAKKVALARAKAQSQGQLSKYKFIAKILAKPAPFIMISGILFTFYNLYRFLRIQQLDSDVNVFKRTYKISPYELKEILDKSTLVNEKIMNQINTPKDNFNIADELKDLNTEMLPLTKLE